MNRLSFPFVMAAGVMLAGCSEQALSPQDGGSEGGVLGIGTIGNFVWHDLNANGVQDVGEPGIPGVTLTLVGSEETKTATTDANGMYLFEELGADTYTVTVTPPVGYTASPTGAGTPETDSNPNPATVVLTDEVFDDLTIDFGFFIYVPPTGEIGDYVWMDTNGNGIQDETGTGIAGVVVTLTGPGGTQTTTTDANGMYLFTGLTAGCYTVSTPTPVGTVPSPTGAGTTATDSNGSPAAVCLPTDSSIDHTIDFGFMVNANPAIRLIKKTNGTDNNTAPGVQVAVGSTVTWTYEVTNTGDVVLSPVNVTDDIVGAICTIASLAVGETQTCTKTGTAIAGQYTNMGTAVGTAPDGRTVTSEDPDNYHGLLPLSATKTAAGTYDRTVTWTLVKTVDDDMHIGEAGEDEGDLAGTSNWTVVATKSATEGNYRVTGTIVVTNSNAFAADFSVTDVLSDGTSALVSCPSGTVGANSSITCTYVAMPSGRTATGNTATVTSGVGGATATAAVSFTANLVGSETATLADPRFTYSQTISSSQTVTFPETFQCPTERRLYINGVYDRVETNVATLRFGSTTLTDDATVTVKCRMPTGAFRTQTIGGWGQNPRGNNAGAFLHANFDNIYGDAGVTIGGDLTVTFTSAQAITDYLPAGGTPARLTTSAVNPTSTAAGVFAAQVLGVQLAVDFSAASLTRYGFGNLRISSGTLAGKTVAEALAIANAVLGGAPLPAGVSSISALSDVMTKINENFVDGKAGKGYLIP